MTNSRKRVPLKGGATRYVIAVDESRMRFLHFHRIKQKQNSTFKKSYSEFFFLRAESVVVN